MINITCDKCGHNEYDVEKEENYFLDIVDSIDVYLECKKCNHKEKM